MKIKKRKKLLSVCLVLVLAACATIGGVLAMQVTAENSKTATSADVDWTKAVEIGLIQHQRQDGGFVEHEDDKPLYPLIGKSAIIDDPNFVDWFVTVKNKGTDSIYARILIAIPVVFDVEYEGEKPVDILFGDCGDGPSNSWKAPEPIQENVVCGDIECNIYSIMYKTDIKTGVTVQPYGIQGMYMHRDVTNKNNQYYFKGHPIKYDMNQTLGIKAIGQAVQTEGFDSPEAAFAASILMDNPWMVGEPEVIQGKTMADALNALPNGSELVSTNITEIVFDRPSEKYDALLTGCESKQISDETTAYYLEDNGTWKVYILSNHEIKLKGDCSGLFKNMANVEKIVTKNLDTSEVTNMNSMFYGCANLKHVDVSEWDTSNVQDMGFMFYGCNNIDGLDVDYWNTSKVTSMSQMFHSCYKLTELDTEHWDVSKVRGWSYMFFHCNELEKVDVSSWVDKNTTSLLYMFANCHKLKEIDVSEWDTSNVKDMGLTFYQCYEVENLDLSNWNTSNVTSMSQMFHSCKKLTNLNLRRFDTSKVTTMNYMFWHCHGLTELDLSTFSAQALTDTTNMLGNCSNLKTIYVSDLWTDTFKNGNVDSAGMFTTSTKLVGGAGTTYNASHVDGSYARIDGGVNAPGYFTKKSANNQ